MIRLVLNADDLGLAAPLSSAVAALLAAGHVTDASLLACGSAFEAAVHDLRAARVAAVGVHLCVVGGEAPVAPPDEVPSLLRGGRFRSAWPSVAAAVATGRILAREVEAEWDAQISRVEEAGLRVTHLDSHQHLHLLPSLLPVAVRLARRHGVPFVRAPLAGTGTSRALPFAARAKSVLVSRFGSPARAAIRAAGLPEPPAAVGLAEAGGMTYERWKDLLGSLRGGTYEAVLHPGAEDPAAEARYGWGYRWEEEARVLRSQALRDLFTGAGVETTSFSALSA